MSSKISIQNHALETMSDSESLLIEDRLWWVQGRKAIINEFLKRSARYCAISNIMDIGCGSGGSFDVLAGFGRVIGVEPSETLARRARSRGIAETVLQQDALELDECRNMDLFTMFDVLEHIKNDKLFLANLRKKAAHKHLLLLSVPACKFLYSDHDRILHHFRRYTNNMLRSTLNECGYQVLHMSYFMFFLFPFALFARMKDQFMAKLGRKRATVEIGNFPTILSVPFAAMLKIEALLSQKIKFPIGLWLFAIAESNDKSQPHVSRMQTTSDRDRHD